MSRPLYSQFKDGFYCGEHKLIFKDKCPKCTHTPLFPVESKNVVGVTLNDFTSNSQAITSKSQGVSKRSYVRKVKSSIFERFHNYGVKFEANIFSEALFQYPLIRLNNSVSYYRIDYDEAIVKVFKKSILVTLRSSKEIKGLDVRTAESKSREIIFEVVRRLPKAIVVKNLEVVNTHNAFVNHPIAKHDLKVLVNGQARLISDHSKGYLELEAVNPQEAVSDSVLIEDDLKGLIVQGLSRDYLASAIDSLIKDRYFHAENMRSHVEAIQQLSKGIAIFNAQMDARFESRNFDSFHTTSFSSHPENVGGALNPRKYSNDPFISPSTYPFHKAINFIKRRRKK